MKQLLNKLLESFHINGRDFAVFLLALLLAFSIWIIHNLSLNYTDYLKVTIVSKCNIDGHSDKSANKCDVIARCRTRGYNLIRSKLREDKKVVEVEFNPAVMEYDSADMYYVKSSDLMEYAHLIYGNDVNVDYFITDTLFFRHPEVRHKRVAVNPVHSFTFKQQYMESGSIELVPDSVTVYGEAFLLDNITQVNTKAIRLYDLDSDERGLVQIESVKGIRMSASQVSYSVGVTRYVQMNSVVPVVVDDTPAGKEVIVVPSSVRMSLKCRFPIESDPFENMTVHIPYSDIASSLSGKYAVKIDMPKGVLDYDSEPAIIQCLVEER